MVVARAGEMLLIGLSRGNLDRLTRDMPIRVPPESITGATQITILFGETEEAIADLFIAAGAITDETVIRDHKMGRQA